MIRIVPTLRATLLLMMLAASGGCGLKGDLYLPEPAPADAPADAGDEDQDEADG